jgi:hypothetical protein
VPYVVVIATCPDITTLPLVLQRNQHNIPPEFSHMINICIVLLIDFLLKRISHLRDIKSSQTKEF